MVVHKGYTTNMDHIKIYNISCLMSMKDDQGSPGSNEGDNMVGFQTRNTSFHHDEEFLILESVLTNWSRFITHLRKYNSSDVLFWLSAIGKLAGLVPSGQGTMRVHSEGLWGWSLQEKTDKGLVTDYKFDRGKSTNMIFRFDLFKRHLKSED